MVEALELINKFVWGLPTLLLILAAGLYLSIGTRWAQLTMFPKALRSFFAKLKPDKNKEDGVSGYQALCTALAATVGTGNIAGVAGAIALGGPGSIFWMWICAFFGMIIKCAEATLAVRYRQRSNSGEWVGGPMYMIKNGLGPKWSWLATLYCVFGVVAAFGVGNATQVNAVIGGINSAVTALGGAVSRKTDIAIGIGLAIIVGLMLSGGAARIGRIAEYLVPYASFLYLLLGAVVLVVRAQAIPAAFSAIIAGAFEPKAVTGGIVGSVFVSMRTGAARGVFTNEAGMGTASIAHASARVEHPAEQGMMGIMEVFIDTILICTMTALVILCSGVDISYGNDAGASLTTEAFSLVYGGWISVVIAASLCCFAFATILGWGLYGLRCAQYLFGEKVWTPFVFFQVFTVILGAVLQTGTVWMLAESVNGLMAIPNLIALLFLSPEFFALIREYRIEKKDSTAVFGGTYENIDQRKSLRTVSHAEIPSSGG